MPLYISIIKFQEKNLNLNREANSDLQISSLEDQDSFMVEREVRDLKVRVRVPVQVQTLLLKFNNVNVQRHKL